MIVQDEFYVPTDEERERAARWFGIICAFGYLSFMAFFYGAIRLWFALVSYFSLHG